MAVYLVTYDLNKEVRRPNIVEVVKSFNNWARLSESSYAVETNLGTDQVFNLFKPLLDDNDQLYVITLKRPHTGWGPKTVNDWLDAKLTW